VDEHCNVSVASTLDNVIVGPWLGCFVCCAVVRRRTCQGCRTRVQIAGQNNRAVEDWPPYKCRGLPRTLAQVSCSGTFVYLLALSIMWMHCCGSGCLLCLFT